MPLLALLAGYLWGSIPTARLVARLSGQRLAGNVGALNTIRSIGLKAGIAVAVLDVAKGAAAVLTARYALDASAGWVLFAGVGCVIGHNWMVWLGFKGGKGMAAAAGAVLTASLIYSQGWVFLVFAGIILAVWRLGRNLVLGNAVALLCLPGLAWLASHSAAVVLAALCLNAVIALKYAPDAIADFKRRGFGALGPDEIKPKRS
ncbi:glycerol-3-phosphate acyltransferase [Dehalogenimonas sp. 4OHTPN]|uniref:Glycerol-3-phosphate acyltransferase n=1 Tax=Dehalogenimonas sp. 4OHTPN TaxID=3166643 RepID=A0AAU8GAS6_9CHLR